MQAWLDATAGVAGDMLLGALVDAGVPLEVLSEAVDAVAPGSVRLTQCTVERAGMRATKVDVALVTADPSLSHWSAIRSRVEQAPLAHGARRRALAIFARLAEAEARVHGVPLEDVHFHEVGAWDSIADVVGVAAGLEHLDIQQLTVSPVSVGAGQVRTAHGVLPVPVPAVLELSRGLSVQAGGDGELATPTGMAVIAAMAQGSRTLPGLMVSAVGIGAGTRDPQDRANIVRLVVGAPEASSGPVDRQADEAMTVLETNVDDLDPRVWPTVLAALLDAGAADAWLVPIVMKKGRPAHTLAVLAPQGRSSALRDQMLRLTSTLGVRETPVQRHALDRSWVGLTVFGMALSVKVASRDGQLLHATPEFDDAVRVASAAGVPVRRVLEEATAALVARGLVEGEPVPDPTAQ